MSKGHDKTIVLRKSNIRNTLRVDLPPFPRFAREGDRPWIGIHHLLKLGNQ